MVARPSLKRAVPGSVPPWRALCAELARALNLFCCSNPSSGRFRAFWVRPSCPRVGRRRGGAPPQLPWPSGRASANGPGLVSFCERVFFVAPSLFRAAATFFVAAPRFSTSGNQEGAAAWSKRSWLCAAQNFQAGGALQLNANSKSSPSRWGCFMKRFSADVVSCAQKLAATLCPCNVLLVRCSPNFAVRYLLRRSRCVLRKLTLGSGPGWVGLRSKLLIDVAMKISMSQIL